MLETVGHRVVGGLAVDPALAHAGHQEYLVVHREAKDNADEDDRQEADDRLRVGDDAQPPLLPDRHGQTERGRHRQAEAQRGDQWHPDRAEHQHEQDERQHQDDPHIRQQHLAEPLRDVLEDRGHTGDGVGGAGLGLERTRVGADLVQHVGGPLVGGTVRGGDEHLSGVTGLVGGDDLRVHHTVEGLDVGGGGAEGDRALLGRHLKGVHQRDHGRSSAGAECLLGEVVRGAVGGARRHGAVGGHGQAQLHGRQGEQDQQEDAGAAEQDRPGADPAHPLQAHGGLLVLRVRGLDTADTDGEHAGAERTQDGGQQRDGHEHGDHHGDGGGQRHGGEERDVDDRQGGQGHHHGETGEHDRGAGLAHGQSGQVGTRAEVDALELVGQLGRLEVIAPDVFDQFGAEARHDEQGVVDTHRQADHGGQGRGEVVDRVGQRGGGEDAADADAHADDAGEQGHAGGNERAEGDQQDHGCHGDADDLALRADLRHLEGVARVGDRQVIGVLGHHVLEGRAVLRQDVHVRLGVERDLESAGGLVGTERAQRGDVGLDLLCRDALLGLGGGELLGQPGRGEGGADQRVSACQEVEPLQVSDERVDALRHLGIGEGAALGGPDDDRAGGRLELAALSFEPLLQLLLGLDGLQARDREGGAGLLAQCGRGGADAQDDEQPGRDEPPPVEVGGPPDAVEN